MKLIDTSCWIEAFRPAGDSSIRKQVYALMEEGQAAWCDAVRLELWNSSRGPQDAKRLRDLETYITSLPITEDVFEQSVDLAITARRKGITVPSLDLIIAACARYHNVPIESRDKHFEQLLKLK